MLIHRFIFAAVCLTFASAGAQAHSAASINDIARRLDRLEGYSAAVTFTVGMPQLADDVIYSLSLNQQADPADSLMNCRYLISWQLTSADKPTSGFSAYYDGNHFRFAGERLQEYHITDDPLPFRDTRRGNRTTPGVHRAAQFVNLLPSEIARELHKMEADSVYTIKFHPDTLISGRKCLAVEAVMDLNGSVAQEIEYVFDAATALPWRMRFENNPGSVSEQTVDIIYTSMAEASTVDPVNEQMLIGLYPDVFASLRQSNYRVENLPGSQLPGFALPTSTGERYSRRSADAFRAPTVLALLDIEGGFSPDVVAALRRAVDMLPYQADIIWAFVDNNVDRVEPVVGSIRPGEHLLMSATPLARDCGVANFPVVIIADKSGRVANVIIGYNHDLSSDVIQKMATLKP